VQQEVARIVAGVDRSNFLELRQDGVDVGRYALYEFLLDHKKSNLEFTDEEWQEYLVALSNSLLTLRACRTILDEEQPDRVVTYNSLYSVNRICCELAEAKGIPSFFLHTGGNLSNRLQTLKFGKGHTVRFLQNVIRHWNQYKHLPAPAALLSNATDHYLELLSSKSVFVYSASKSTSGTDIRTLFGIGRDQRILLATMSSYDERFAGEVVGVFRDDHRLLFDSQIEWIKTLIKFVDQRKELFLLIRVHPREFPNRRDGVKSEHAALLERTFDTLPDNARVNWPTDGVSMYDLADETAVVLNAWSTVGKEMSLLGLPVVIYSPDLLFYPSDLNYVGTSFNDYFETVEQALREGWSSEWVRKTYRWLALEYGYSLIDISDSYSEKENAPPPPLPRRLLNRAWRTIQPYSP